MNNVKPFNMKSGKKNDKADACYLKSEVAYRSKLQEISNAVYAASDIDGILIDAAGDIVEIMGARRITIYYIDGIQRELVSRFKSGDEINEIRVPVNKHSIAGYCAVTRQMVNIRNVYDARELAGIDPELGFDRSWDEKTGFETRQVLAAPIVFQSVVLGAIQLINRKKGGPFSAGDEKKLSELATILGIALYKQQQMTARLKGRFNLLLENYIITREELDDAVIAARERNKPVERFLVEDMEIDKSDVLKSLSRYYNLPAVEYSDDMDLPADIIAGLDPGMMEKQECVPAGFENGDLLVAMADPGDLECLARIREQFSGYTVRAAVAMKKDVLNMLRLAADMQSRPARSLQTHVLTASGPVDQRDESSALLTEKSPEVAEFLRNLLAEACRRGASAIHFEPEPDQMEIRLRFRTDGVCAPGQTISASLYQALVLRVKAMAGLDIARTGPHQHGRLRFQSEEGRDAVFQVTIIATAGGREDLVMRMQPAAAPMSIDALGLGTNTRQAFAHALEHAHGLILVSGPPKSGRTTTLHAALAQINAEEKKIWTAEKNLEILQPGLRQVRVEPAAGYDYAVALESFVYADADSILIDDMPDGKTANAAVSACLSGKLVLSGFTGPGAPETLARLVVMDADAFHLAEALICILSQRLVRTLCTRCRQARHPGRKEYDQLVSLYGKAAFARDIDIAFSKNLTFYAPAGCPECSHTGYKGQTGIFELLSVTDEIRDIIQTRPPGRHLGPMIREHAVSRGMSTLFQDGIAKVFAGHCDLAQVRRACLS
ncbi:MAG: Flp pilus assembly complex ATPase component TadA [Desulfobacteraceae bacterium]|nr:Flp pilus assembly complex ATPase component TadA [Desulfobacteraceae bacterium]